MLDDAAQVREFAEELTRIQRSLYGYICSLVGCPEEAQDVLQETNREVWERYEEFEPGSSLAAWTYKIAYYRVLTVRKQRKRRQQRFQETTLELLAERMAEKNYVLEARHQALLDCVGKLEPADRHLIQTRYLEGVDVAEIAEKLRRAPNSLYRSLARIRGLLLDCIESLLEAEGIG